MRAKGELPCDSPVQKQNPLGWMDGWMDAAGFSLMRRAGDLNGSLRKSCMWNLQANRPEPPRDSASDALASPPVLDTDPRRIRSLSTVSEPPLLKRSSSALCLSLRFERPVLSTLSRRRRRGANMKAIGNGGEWWWNLPSLRRKSDSRRRGRRNTDPRGRRRGPPREPLSSSSSSSESIEQGRGWPIEFPFRQAVTAASLTFTGDTIAQVRSRIVDRRRCCADSDTKELIPDILLNHDWIRALRMASYGFLLYGPGSYAWYQLLDRCMPKQTFVNLSAKVILNQIVLGPCVIAVIFAWNNLWLGKLSELPAKYQNDALPTLLYGFKFWIPVSIVNFGVIPLPARVAFMSSCSIFWNFYLSTTMSK